MTRLEKDSFGNIEVAVASHGLKRSVVMVGRQNINDELSVKANGNPILIP